MDGLKDESLDAVNNHLKNLKYYMILITIIGMLVITDLSYSILSLVILEKRIYIFLAIIIFYLIIILLFNQNIVLDIIFVTLFLRVPFYLIHPIFFNSFNESFLSNYIIVIIPIIVYQLIVGIGVNKNKLIKSIVAISISIMFIQTSYVFLNSVLNAVPDYLFKSTLVIPLGASNYIAAIFIILGLMSMAIMKTKFFALLSLVGIFLTLSNSGIITSVVVIIILFIRNFKKIKTKYLLLIFLSSIFVVLSLIFAFNYFFDNNYLITVFDRYINLINGAIDLLNGRQSPSADITNGRIQIYEDTFNLFLEKPLFGWGIGIVENLTSKVHNWLLQSLINGGLVGTVIYFLPLGIASVKLFYSKHNKLAFYMLLVIFASLFQGMVEPNYFTPTVEFYLWLFIGYTLTISHNENKYWSDNKDDYNMSNS